MTNHPNRNRTSIDYGLRCVKSARQGEHSFYEILNGKRSHATVEHDSKIWLYDLRGCRDLRAFRAFIYTAWGERGATVKITGSYPRYFVETVS